jgi:cobalt-zinc-cadmium efflux system protein
VAFGISTGSLALLADAAHNLTEVAGLLLAWGALRPAAQPKTGMN